MVARSCGEGKPGRNCQVGVGFYSARDVLEQRWEVLNAIGLCTLKYFIVCDVNFTSMNFFVALFLFF